MNLLQETLEVMAKHNKTPDNVEWVGIVSEYYNSQYYTWEDFEKQAKDMRLISAYGFTFFDMSFVVVGEDWWLERRRGCMIEWWDFKTIPIRPKTKANKLDFSYQYDMEGSKDYGR